MIHLRARVPLKANGDGVGKDPTGSGHTPHTPIPDWIEIEQIASGFLLIHVYLGHTPFIHTWHETLEEAKAEAKEEFLVQEDAWEAVSPDDRTE